MFYNATSFNQNIGDWNVSNVTNLNNMFEDAASFNQPDIQYWEVSSNAILTDMFLNSPMSSERNIQDSVAGDTPSHSWFNQLVEYESNGVTLKVIDRITSLSDFELHNNNSAQTVIDGVTYTVVDDSDFHSEISGGNYNLITTFVTDMSGAFEGDASFNEDISEWDTSNVTTMYSMFLDATSFNQDISYWDTSKVTTMRNMFLGSRLQSTYR